MRHYLPLILIIGIAVLRIFVYYSKLKSNEQQTIIQTDNQLSAIQQASLSVVYRYLPSPHSELLLGMVIGVDKIGDSPKFKQTLKRSGTSHVVVVSGFNVSLVFGMVIKALGSRYKLRNFLIAASATLFYAIVTGFQPPVVRAWVMGLVISLAKYYGRTIDSLQVLIFTAAVMTLISPEIAFSWSFQLSFTACLGLVCFSGYLSRFKLPEDLTTTIAAQTLVWPLISYYFGTVSLISFVVNPLILWTVPIATSFGFINLTSVVFPPFITRLTYIFVFPFLDMFVRICDYFGNLPFASINYKISLVGMLCYYLLALFFIKHEYKKT